MDHKLAILCQISDGLKTIYHENFIHRDFHSGNILSLKNNHKKWIISRIMKYMEKYLMFAPEIFQGGVFSKESDIYSLGMVMWELTIGRKPFFNIEYDIELVFK
uniref:Protein kinase domain-containing protein n=1 Tax=Rhizophagus irregularis (strain DAOM 181602 / DAOM 197198 / MUCL 43194) TaxID=747089 RepID=U9U1C1_RHIID